MPGTVRSSHQQELSWGFVLVFLFLIGVVVILHYKERTSEHTAKQSLMSLDIQDVHSFKIHPEKTSTEDYHDAIAFAPNDRLVREFFLALRDSTSYHPQHDRGLAHWGMEIMTTQPIRIGCYIPDLQPGVVVGHIRTDAGSGYFQSRLLLRWYQKYGHYWRVGSYQKLQYGRVKPSLTSISLEDITSFKIILPSVNNASEVIHEYPFDAAIVSEFFQALEDIHFADQIYSEYLEHWSLHILTNAMTVKIECVIPAENPTTVIGFIESAEGGTYFQSQILYKWYEHVKMTGLFDR